MSTTEITNITESVVICGGNVTSVGGSVVTARGVCWSNSSNPTILNSKTNNGTGSGTYSSTITGFTFNKTYYVRSYATNSIGTAYGTEIVFSTSLPTITTTNISSISASTATCGGNVTTVGGADVTVRGICWSTTSNPTILNSKTSDGTGIGTFTSSINGLIVGTTYYVRAYATNSIGTVYGSQISFSTTLPTLTTSAITDIKTITCTGGGNITSSGGSDVISKGVCWSTNQNPTTNDNKTSDGIGIGSLTSSLTNLVPGTTYYVRAYATNSIGTSYGSQVSVTMKIAIISTSSISSITASTAISGGNITDTGGLAIIASGICWSTSSDPSISDNITSNGVSFDFTSSINGLTINNTYFVRSYVTTIKGTAYGNEIVFSTLLPTVIASSVSILNSSTGSCTGNVTSNGGAQVSERGVCWNTSPSPTINNSKTIDNNGIGSFNNSITSISLTSVYYLRAYATNSIGTAYSSEISFSVLPIVTTNAVTYSQGWGNQGGGTVTSIGGAQLTARGICYSQTNTTPTKNDKVTNDTVLDIGSFNNLFFSNLNGYVRCYVRAFATNQYGTSYGVVLSFNP